MSKAKTQHLIQSPQKQIASALDIQHYRIIIHHADF